MYAAGPSPLSGAYLHSLCLLTSSRTICITRFAIGGLREISPAPAILECFTIEGELACEAVNKASMTHGALHDPCAIKAVVFTALGLLLLMVYLVRVGQRVRQRLRERKVVAVAVDREMRVHNVEAGTQQEEADAVAETRAYLKKANPKGSLICSRATWS